LQETSEKPGVKLKQFAVHLLLNKEKQFKLFPFIALPTTNKKNRDLLQANPSKS